MSKQTICLTMIVRNESRVIERCLASVRELISAWLIVDTGSTDGTQAIVRRALAGLPGELVERPWVDFAHNRTEALAYARGKAEYLLIVDADEMLGFEPGFEWPTLTADAYRIETRYGGLAYWRIQLLKDGGDWFYRGVLHEQLDAATPKSIAPLPGVFNLPRPDGARSSDPHKFRRDALTLERALLDEPDNARYQFYLAQSYRDAGDYEAALRHYRRRVAMGGDGEEVWYARYQLGLMLLLTGAPWEQALDALLSAYAAHPERAEPLYQIAVYYRERRAYPLAALFAQQAVNIARPAEGLFVETAVYDYKIPFEYAICCYWSGRHADAIAVNNQILSTPGVSPEIFDQAIKNRRYSLDALYPRRAAPLPRTNHMTLLVLMRNPGAWLDNCIASLLAQEYPAFDMIFVDEGSTDGAHTLVPTDDPRVTLRRLPTPLARLQTIQTCVLRLCRPEDIVVCVDGADWLADRHVLATLNDLYNAHDCAVLYGQYREANGRYGGAMPYPNAASMHQPGGAAFAHLIRSFRADVLLRIQASDPDYACMKDAQGRWRDLRRGDDRALMLPLMRAAGFERVRFSDQVMYILNTDHPEAAHAQP